MLAAMRRAWSRMPDPAPLQFANSTASYLSCTEEFDMRHLVIAVVVAAGACLVGSLGASATPANGQAILNAADHANSITDVAGGCGRGWHRNRWGHCVP